MSMPRFLIFCRMNRCMPPYSRNSEGLLAALRAGPAAEYSAWLDLAFTAVNQLQPVTRKLVLANLADGPRRDARATFAGWGLLACHCPSNG